MNLSSIFNFKTLIFSRRDVVKLASVIFTATMLITTAEVILRMDKTPKALPFESTRTGTLVDYAIRNPSPYDYLFLGSSQCAYNISPNHFNHEWELAGGGTVRSMNIGIPGSNIRTVAAFYEKCGDLFKTETLVIVASIVGGDAYIQEKISNNYGTDYLEGSLHPAEQAMMTLNLFKYRRQYRDLRYQFYVIKKRSLIADLDRRIGPYGLGWHPGQGGFLKMTDENAIAETSSKEKKEYILTNPAETDLQKNISSATADGCKVIILVPPQPPRFNKLMKNPDEEWFNFLKQMRDLAAKKNCILLDHHSLKDFPDASFFDSTHLRNNEAERYSRFLARELYIKLEKK